MEDDLKKNGKRPEQKMEDDLKQKSEKVEDTTSTIVN
jgi:hypothetical protein